MAWLHPSPNRAHTSLLAILALAAGCAAPSRERVPLDPAKQAVIASRARSADELGVTVGRSSTGDLLLADTLNVPLGVTARVALNARPSRAVHFPIVRAELNGKTVLALVDTGSSVSLIDYYGAVRAGLVPITISYIDTEGNPRTDMLTRQGMSLGGTTHLITALARSATLGDLKVYNVPLGILNDERGLGWMWWLDGFRVEAIIGQDLLGAFDHMTLNLEREYLRLASGRYRPDPDKLVAAVPLRQRFGLPAVEATIDGKGPFDVVLDSGAEFGLWIPRGLAERMGLPELRDYETNRMGRGVAGQTAYITGSPRGLDISGFALSSVPTAIALVRLGSAEPPYVLLGLRVLRDYSTTIDYKAGKVYFERP